MGLYLFDHLLFTYTDQVQSATFFREAAGVYQYLAKEILPAIQHCLPSERPPEVIPSTSAVMSLVCLAEAQVSLFALTNHFEFSSIKGTGY